MIDIKVKISRNDSTISKAGTLCGQNGFTVAYSDKDIPQYSVIKRQAFIFEADFLHCIMSSIYFIFAQHNMAKTTMTYPKKYDSNYRIRRV